MLFSIIMLYSGLKMAEEFIDTWAQAEMVRILLKQNVTIHKI